MFALVQKIFTVFWQVTNDVGNPRDIDTAEEIEIGLPGFGEGGNGGIDSAKEEL